MKGKKRQAWIEEGYKLVARTGFEGLGVESISRSMNKSKSSFYHYFGEMEVFREELLHFHLSRAVGFGRDISACKNVRPELVDVFLDYQTDIFFHKQLHINRDYPSCKKCIDKVYEVHEKPLVEKWIDYFGLSHKKMFAKTFHRFMTEHFCLLIVYETYNREWILNYLKGLYQMLQQLKAGD